MSHDVYVIFGFYATFITKFSQDAELEMGISGIFLEWEKRAGPLTFQKDWTEVTFPEKSWLIT